MLNKEYILEQLEKYCDFDETLCEETFYDLIVYPLQKAECFPVGKWTYDEGVTKGVLIFDDLDYVIKIPFYCEYIEDYIEYNEETEEYEVIEEGGPTCEPFGGISVKGFTHLNDWDYCETEQYRYLVAKEKGFGDCFAQTWYLRMVRGWPIYAQSRANMFESNSSRETRSKRNYTEKQIERVRELKNSTGSEIATEWVLDFVNYYSEERFIDLMEFCYKNKIDDLHIGNIGYVCGVPCIIDYSSFWN